MNIDVKLDSNLNLDATELEKAIQEELEDSAYQIEKQAKANCPVSICCIIQKCIMKTNQNR